MISRKVYPYLYLLFLVLTFYGCNLKKNYSFSFDLDCKPPCWQRIKPGVTTEQEALLILKSLSNIDQNRITKHGEQWLIFDDIIYFHSIPENWNGYAYILNHNVVLIDFTGNLLMTFEDAININGDPKFVINIPIYSGPPGVPTESYLITAIYPDLGVSYTYNTSELPKRKTSELMSDTPISMIAYFDPDKYDEFLEAKLFSMSFLGRKDTLKYLRPWTGFGSIEDKYPPAVIP
jgi:hypothetical protein